MSRAKPWRTWSKGLGHREGRKKLRDAIGPVFLQNREVIKIKILSGLEKEDKKSTKSMGGSIP